MKRQWAMIAVLCVAASMWMGCKCNCLEAIIYGATPYGAIEPGEWITNWQALDAIARGDQNGLEVDWLAQRGGEEALAMPGADAPANARELVADASGMIDLADALGNLTNQVAYAWADVESDEEGFAVLQLGSDDGVRVWVNGEEVWSHRVFRAANPDQDQVVVWLREGSNRILLKVEQGTGDWKFCARLSEAIPAQDEMAFGIVEPIEAPVALIGSELPIAQSIRVKLLQTGGDVVEGLRLACLSDSFETTLSESFTSGPGLLTEVQVPFEIEDTVQPGTLAVMMLGAELPGGRVIPVREFPIETARVHPLLRGANRGDNDLLVVQVSDTHIQDRDSVLAGVNTGDRLATVIDEINAMNPQPDFVAVTGDFTNNEISAYPVYADLVGNLRAPVLTVFGNHDKVQSLSASVRAFSEWGLPEFYAFTRGGMLFIGLDSVNSSDPAAPGEINPLELEWLRDVLASTDESPVVAFIHHDLFSGRGVSNFEEVQDLFNADGREVWIFSGHWHADTFVRVDNQRHVITASTGYLFGDMGLPHDHGEPGYRLIHIEDGEVHTQFKPIGGPARDDPPTEEFLSPEEIVEILEAAD